MVTFAGKHVRHHVYAVFPPAYLNQGGPPGLTWANWINIKEMGGV